MERQNNTIEGECSKCGKCCTSLLPMSEYEINKIKKFVQRKHFVPYDRNTNSEDYVDVCPFLNWSNECSIYGRRPEVCVWFSCDGSDGNFKHKDKNIINLYEEFFPNIKLTNPPDVERMNNIYKLKKEKAGL